MEKSDEKIKSKWCNGKKIDLDDKSLIFFEGFRYFSKAFFLLGNRLIYFLVQNLFYFAQEYIERESLYLY